MARCSSMFSCFRLSISAILLVVVVECGLADAFFATNNVGSPPAVRSSSASRLGLQEQFECDGENTNNGADGNKRIFEQSAAPSRRRSILQWACSAALPSLLASTVPANNAALAAEDTATAGTQIQLDDPSLYPPVTQKVYLDVRISRSDGTFYVRDDPPDVPVGPENKVFTGRVILGLFGTVAPNHVEQFLKYANVKYNPSEDNPLPSYGRSAFRQLDQSTGLLMGGTIPGLDITGIGGGTNLKYGGRIFPAPLWIEAPGSSEKRISHRLGKGLLTHRTLDASPSFGITTRPAGYELDDTNVVFGRVLPDDSSDEFLRICRDEIPTYSMDRPAQPDGDVADRAVAELAGSVFSAQRDFFRGAAKSFGDTRVDKVYEGKLLRRVEVTQVGLL